MDRISEAERETLKEKLKDIRENPSRHRHDFEGLHACAMINGYLHLEVIEAHEGLNGPSRRCDVSKGPCACGAWH